MKKGTTGGTAKSYVNKAGSGVRHGPAVKNVVTGGKSAPKPSAPTGPIKGMDKGGV